MRVLFTGFFPQFLVHFVSELDFIEEHLASGDEVSLLACNGDLGTCECNRYHVYAGCATCIGKRQHGVSLLSKKIHILPLITDTNAKFTLPKVIKNVDELKSIYIEEFDIGEAVYSSLIDRCMNTQPDLEAERAAVQTMFNDSYRVWLCALELLRKKKFDKVYIFNGRFNTTRAWVRACQRVGIPFFTHERSMKLGRTFLIEGALPHDPRTYKTRINEFLARSRTDPEVIREGCEFFEERRRGENSAWKVFTGDQKKGEMPEGWSTQRRNICFFASTEREFVGVKQFTPPWIYESQIEAIRDIIPKAVSADPSLMFYLRIHPNSRRERIRWWDSIEFTSMKNLCIIPPESPVSTYALMEGVEKCMCFRSSMGIESAYWGKPSIVLTWAFYAGLDAVYEPKTREEALNLVLARLDAKPRANAVKFGSFLRCGGKKLVHSQPVGISELRFKNVDLRANSAVRSWNRHCFNRPKVSGLRSWIRGATDWVSWQLIKTRYSYWFADCPKSNP